MPEFHFVSKIKNIKDVQKLFFIIFIGLIITLIITYTIPLRLDEPYTMITTGNSPQLAIHRALNFELQPPFYFVVLSIWREVNHSLMWARLFSVIFYPFIVILSYRMAKNYVPEFKPLLFSALVAFNPFVIMISSYSREYSLLLFLATALFVLYYEAYLSGKNKKRYRVLYIAVSIIGLYTQYFFGFILFAAGISLLLLKDKSVFKIYLLDMILPLLSLTLLIPFLPAQIDSVFAPIEKVNSILSGLYIIFNRIEFYLFPVNELRFPFVFRLLILGTIFLIFVYSVYSILKSKKYPNKNVIIIISVLFISSLFFVLILKIFGKLYFHPRHTTTISIALIFIFYVFVSMVKNKRVRIMWTFIILAVFFGSLIKDYYYTKSIYIPLTQATDYIRSNELNKEPILIYSFNLQLEFPYFYKGSNPLINLPRSINVNGDYNKSKWVYHNIDDIKNNWAQFKKLKTFWLITDNSGSDVVFGINYNYNLLNNYVAENFNIIDSKKIGKYQVEKLTPLKD